MSKLSDYISEFRLEKDVTEDDLIMIIEEVIKTCAYTSAALLDSFKAGGQEVVSECVEDIAELSDEMKNSSDMPERMRGLIICVYMDKINDHAKQQARQQEDIEALFRGGNVSNN